MGTTDTITAPEEPCHLFPWRAPAFSLPTDPSEEELAQYWTLSVRDKAEIATCRGEAQRRRFAVQLSYLAPLRPFPAEGGRRACCHYQLSRPPARSPIRPVWRGPGAVGH